MSWDRHFDRFAVAVSCAVASSRAFSVACVVVLAWAAAGPVLGFSQTWQLLINTGTTIATFLMVFLLQHAQERDTRAIHAKLDELVRAVDNASNAVIGIEQREDES